MKPPAIRRGKFWTRQALIYSQFTTSTNGMKKVPYTSAQVSTSTQASMSGTVRLLAKTGGGNMLAPTFVSF